MPPGSARLRPSGFDRRAARRIPGITGGTASQGKQGYPATMTLFMLASLELQPVGSLVGISGADLTRGHCRVPGRRRRRRRAGDRAVWPLAGREVMLWRPATRSVPGSVPATVRSSRRHLLPARLAESPPLRRGQARPVRLLPEQRGPASALRQTDRRDRRPGSVAAVRHPPYCRRQRRRPDLAQCAQTSRNSTGGAGHGGSVVGHHRDHRQSCPDARPAARCRARVQGGGGAVSPRCQGHRRGHRCAGRRIRRCAVRWSTRQGLGAVAFAERLQGLDPAHVPRLFLAKGNYFTVTGKPGFSHLFTRCPAGGSGRSPDAGSAGRHTVRPRCRMDRAGGLHRRPDARQGFTPRSVATGLACRKGLCARTTPDPAETAGPGACRARFHDRNVRDHGVPGLVNLFGIESPGLTACLAIADHVSRPAGRMRPRWRRPPIAATARSSPRRSSWTCPGSYRP